MKFIYNVLFGCRHQNYGWPRTKNRQAYVVCLSCGKELPYNLDAMRVKIRLGA